MRVWLYARLSRDEDSELNSLTNQQNILREYAEKNHNTVVGESFDDIIAVSRKILTLSYALISNNTFYDNNYLSARLND